MISATSASSDAGTAPPASAAFTRAELKRLQGAQARAREETLLLSAAGGAAGFALARQAARFSPSLSASGPGFALLCVGGLAAGSAAAALESVRVRSPVFDRSTWHPAVVALVERASALQRGGRQQHE